MSSASRANESTTIQLYTYINERNQLRLSFLGPTGERVSLDPEQGLEDLLARAGREGSLTLEVRDFFQDNTIYEVYGVILEENGRDVAAYWEPTGRGQQYTFASLSQTRVAGLKLVIRAVPRGKGAAVLCSLARLAAPTAIPDPDPDEPPPPPGDPIDIDPKGPTQGN